MEISPSLPWAEGAAQPRPPGRQFCWGLWDWWSQGAFLLFSKVPLLLLGSAFLSHFHARELRGTARGAVGDWGGAGWAEQTNRVWDLYGGVKEPETPWVAQTHLRAGYMQPCSHDQL